MQIISQDLLTRELHLSHPIIWKWWRKVNCYIDSIDRKLNVLAHFCWSVCASNARSRNDIFSNLLISISYLTWIYKENSWNNTIWYVYQTINFPAYSSSTISRRCTFADILKKKQFHHIKCNQILIHANITRQLTHDQTILLLRLLR